MIHCFGKRMESLSEPLCIDNVDTFSHIYFMAQADLKVSETKAVLERKTSGRSSTSERRGSINLRIEAGTRQLIDQAAEALGKTRTEFMVESARNQAIDVLLDQRLYVLNDERFDVFMNALDHPPAPGPKLKALLRKVPAWQK